MIETVWPQETPVEVRSAWARMHGIDPDEVPENEPIIIDYTRRQITYSRVIEDGRGRSVGWQVGDDEESRRVLCERVTVQLESPPRPFPEGGAR